MELYVDSKSVGLGENNPCSGGVVSLWSMLQFLAKTFVELTGKLNAVEARLCLESRDEQLRPDVAAWLCSHLTALAMDATTHELDSIGDQCQRIIGVIQSKPPNCGEVRDALYNLRTRFEDEFGRHFFLHLSRKEAEQYRNPLNQWREAVDRFPLIRYNVEESIKCFALNRYGASAFHILQVAEYGVIQVADVLDVSGDKPGWGSLKRLHDLIKVPFPQRTDLAKQHTKLLEDIVPLALAMKDAWRHKLDHVDNQLKWIDTDFSPNVVEDIVSAVRAFMRKLATDLP